MLQSRANIGHQRLDGLGFRVYRGQVQLGLTGMIGGFTYGCQQQRAAGDGLKSRTWVCRPTIPTWSEYG